jgi:hypothetical protein
MLVMTALLFTWGYSRFRSGADDRKKLFVPPENIDSDLIRIHRAAEDEIARNIVERWQMRGRQQSIAAVYEFGMMPYKPVFFLGATKEGGLDRKKILEEEMRSFQGEMGESDKIIELTKENLSFLCASFRRGSGLVALSAVCVWDDGDSAGFGVRIAGGDLNGTLRYTAEVRKLLLQPPAAAPFPFVKERPPIAPQNESEMDRTMRDIAASLMGYNCARFRTFLPSGSPEMFRQKIRHDILVSIKDPVEKVCFVLSIIKFPRSETMLIRHQTISTDHALLLLTGRAEGDRSIEFALLRADDGWKIDPDWALKQVQNYPVKMSLMQIGMNLQVMEHYSDQPKSSNSDRGMANLGSEPGKVYVKVSANAEAVCASSLSESGELFLIHVDAKKHISYARGSALPGDCPVAQRDSSW